jgi:hypothetical protein
MARRPHRLFLGFNGQYVELECGSEGLAGGIGGRLGHVATSKDPGVPPVLRLTLDEPEPSHFELADVTHGRAHGPLDYVLYYLRSWITEAFVSAHPDLLWLHAAAAASDGAAVLLPGPAGVGKSSLVAALLNLSWRLLADDVVPLDVDRRLAMPLPFNPNVRTGRPDEDDPAAFLEQSKTVVAVSPGQVAQAPSRIAAIVFLEFAPGQGDAVDLTPLTPVAVVQALGDQCLSPCVDRRESLKALWSVAEAVPAYRLRYESASRVACELSRRWPNGFSPKPVT